ncbi:MAG TPA: response regulator transcription factor [Bacillota bacterium]|nr:response regulator transcription factor [Bacillota bacterium]
MNKTVQVLIVEDDEAINNLLFEIVKDEGYEVKQAFSGTEALIYFKEQSFDVILLDLMLPGKTGEELLATFRETSDAAILIISAKETQHSKVNMLRAGADDYITKPFDNAEVAARIEAQLRKYKRLSIPKTIEYKDIVLNRETKEVTVQGKLINLTAREFYLLKLFMEHPQKLFTKKNIFETVWQQPYFDDENIVNVHMSHLRQKLSKANSTEEYIETIWGMGYRLKK